MDHRGGEVVTSRGREGRKEGACGIVAINTERGKREAPLSETRSLPLGRILREKRGNEKGTRLLCPEQKAEQHLHSAFVSSTPGVVPLHTSLLGAAQAIPPPRSQAPHFPIRPIPTSRTSKYAHRNHPGHPMLSPSHRRKINDYTTRCKPQTYKSRKSARQSGTPGSAPPAKPPLQSSHQEKHEERGAGVPHDRTLPRLRGRPSGTAPVHGHGHRVGGAQER